MPPEVGAAGTLHRPSFAVGLLQSIRLDEVAALQGAPVIGACLAISTLTTQNVITAAALVVGNVCLIAHVFTFNDWAGIKGDLRDPQRAERTFLSKGVSRAHVGGLSLALLTIGLLVFAAVSAAAFTAALGIAVLSTLYSAPVVHMKGRSLLNSALHLGGGALHFLLGYAAFAPVDNNALAISAFFGLVFTAGHFTHEARDYEGDKLNGIRTNAVAFGRTQSFLAGLVLFSAAYALLAVLAARALVPSIMVLAVGLYPLHLLASVLILRAGITYDRLKRLQALYRTSFALIGVTIAVVAVLS